MGVPLTAAFAFGRLARVNVFHHSPGNSAAPEHPYLGYPNPPRQKPRGARNLYVMLCSAMAYGLALVS
jgi:hypothetical protein